MELRLTRLDAGMKSALDDFVAEWCEPMAPAAVRQYKGDIKEYLDYLEMMEKDPPRLLVPATVLFLTDGEKILGAIDIRHFLNDGLARYGGHIGYGVRPLPARKRPGGADGKAGRAFYALHRAGQSDDMLQKRQCRQRKDHYKLRRCS